MTRRDLWLALSVVVLLVLAALAFPRYEYSIYEQAVFRWDRWSGELDAVSFRNLKQAPWATVAEPAESDVWREVDKLLEPITTKP
jgi:hypothetical protein